MQATGLAVSESRNTGSDQYFPLEELTFYLNGVDLERLEAATR